LGGGDLLGDRADDGKLVRADTIAHLVADAGGHHVRACEKLIAADGVRGPDRIECPVIGAATDPLVRIVHGNLLALWSSRYHTAFGAGPNGPHAGLPGAITVGE
jgi:hypothetical protein